MSSVPVNSFGQKINTTGIGSWGRGYGVGPAKSRNKKNPTIDDIDWRQLNQAECYRLYHVGTKSGKAQALKAIISDRRDWMVKAVFDEWYKELVKGWKR